MLSYEGLFFDNDMVEIIHSLETDPLELINDEIHCTFKYHPSDDEIFNEIVGKTFEIYLISYGNDGQNSGFQILLPDDLQKYYINFDNENPGKLNYPHITASLSEGAKAINTKKLDFKPLETPIKLVGKFGYWIKEENGEYLSYEAYEKNKSK